MRRRPIKRADLLMLLYEVLIGRPRRIRSDF
jgi:hypothetical protein